MRLFKPTYNDRKGTKQTASRWYVEFRDHLAHVRRLPAYTSKAASAELGTYLVKLVAYHRASGGQVDPALTTWLLTQPAQLVEKLKAYGLLPGERFAAGKLMSEHLTDFAASLTAKDCTPRHVELVKSRAQRIVNGIKAKSFADITATRVMDYLTELRTGVGDKLGLSAQTSNFYLQAIKQFCRWAVKERRAVESAVAHLDGLNVKTDRRHDRRALTVDELRRLLTTVEHRFEVMGLPAFPMARLLVFWGGVQRGFDAFAHNPVEYAVSVKTPTLLMHGARDPRVRTAEVEAIVAGLAGPHRFVLFPNAGHESLCGHDPEKWRAAVSSFLAKSAAQ